MAPSFVHRRTQRGPAPGDPPKRTRPPRIPGCLSPFGSGCRLLSAAILVLASGCGAGYRVVPVSGKVTLDGTPRQGIHVSFQPLAGGNNEINPGPGSYGVTDAQGRYRLQTVEPTQDGAVVGTHRVRFSLPEPKADPRDDVARPARQKLLLQYCDGSLQLAVPAGGTDQADFALTSR
jgi:hypothetical protein